MSIRDEYLSHRFNEFLDRFSPPRSIQNNPKAMQDDADAMLRTVVRFAPRDGYSEWLDGVLITLQDGMTTRSWPSPGEVTKACRAGGKGADDKSAEDQALLRMMAWHERYGSQMPGHGNPARTAELIRRGTLKNERDARFKGFDLSEDDTRRALDQEMTRDEWVHHCNVMAGLHGLEPRDAAQIERRILGEGRAPAMPAIPNKRSVPIDPDTFAA